MPLPVLNQAWQSHRCRNAVFNVKWTELTKKAQRTVFIIDREEAMSHPFRVHRLGFACWRGSTDAREGAKRRERFHLGPVIWNAHCALFVWGLKGEIRFSIPSARRDDPVGSPLESDLDGDR